MLNKVAMTMVVLLVMVAVGLGAWTLGRSIGNAGTPVAEGTATPTPTAKAATREVRPASATGFDPLGTDGAERPELALYAVDGKPSTDWHSESYNSEDLGGLKSGVGLLLTLDQSVPVKQVSVDFGSGSGGSAEIRVGDSQDLKDMTVIGKSAEASGKKIFTAEAPEKGRHVVIWFTKMPTYQGKYRGTVIDVKILATK
jgi:hypothetical protein